MRRGEGTGADGVDEAEGVVGEDGEVIAIPGEIALPVAEGDGSVAGEDAKHGLITRPKNI